MSEEKKIIELNDKELEKVSGGFEIDMYGRIALKAGDCFENPMFKIKVKQDYKILDNSPQNIEVEGIIIPIGETFNVIESSDNIFNERYFKGNDAW